MLDQVKALTFDVFGTVVDWRGSITREGEALARTKNIHGVDWAKFAEAWRALYQPMMQEVRSGRRPWTKLDDLHRMNLDRVLRDFSITGLSEPEIDHLNHVWHRLDPWPDVVAGLTRLKRKYDAVKWQRRAHGEHGQARWAPVGRHPRRRDRARVQTSTRGVSEIRGVPRAAPR